MDESDRKYIDNQDFGENVSVNGSVNDTYKRSVNPALTESKHKAIAELQTCDYRTPPIKIASLLEIIFADYNSKDGHWLYIAQQWPPRRISGVINQLIKIHKTGAKTIQNPASYFTFLIKLRTKRKTGNYK